MPAHPFALYYFLSIGNYPHIFGNNGAKYRQIKHLHDESFIDLKVIANLL